MKSRATPRRIALSGLFATLAGVSLAGHAAMAEHTGAMPQILLDPPAHVSADVWRGK
jgi:putative copper export protein